MASVGNKYFTSLYAPAINAANFREFILSELNRYKKLKYPANKLNHVFLAITNKCPLKCEHCYEWNRLNRKEVLREENLKQSIKKLQNLGVSQIYLTGGEPLIKFDLVLELLNFAGSKTDLWLNTSGFQLTEEKAAKLKAAGLTGIFISLDHHEETEHNHFRNNKNAYSWSIEAAKNAVNQDLLVTLSICTTKEFVTKKNLTSYMELGKSLGVSFIQFIEPKKVGHYQNSEINLSAPQINLLESVFETYNFNDEYLEYPIICYHEYYQRRNTCLSTNNRGLYIDSNGGINLCPFCHTSSGNILEDDLELVLEKMRSNQCLQA
ncbi:hypothetical protein GCM10023115_50670 [Pontixanthobacter gangjinensis]